MISAIIVTHNSACQIAACLTAIGKQREYFESVVLVDNASTDNTLAAVEAGFDFVKILRNPGNLGFSAAVNLGIGQSRSEYVLVMNPDVVLGDNFAGDLKKAIEGLRDPAVGMIVPRILRPDGRIDSTGIGLTWLRRFYDRGRGRSPVSVKAFDGRIIGPSAACAVYARRLLEDIRVDGQYFDEDFFLIAEDVDLAWRAQRNGWKALYLPGALAVHAGGISRNRSPQAQFYSFCNRYFLIIKNESLPGLARLFFVGWLYDIPRLVYFLCTNPLAPEALQRLKNLFAVMVRRRKRMRRVAMP